MIHIIDPRTQSPLQDFYYVDRGRVAKSPRRWINDRNMFCADLVAVRLSTGLYSVLKLRTAPLPVRPIRRKTLQRYIDQVLSRRMQR